MSTQNTTQLPPREQPPRPWATPLNITLAVIGAIALMTMLISTTRSAVASLNSSHEVSTADAQGVTSLDVRANAGNFTLRFEDTEQAVLDVRSTSGREWTLERSGTELAVRPPNGWNEFCFFGCTEVENEITLTLPKELDNGTLDAKFNLNAGEFQAAGNFQDLVVDVNAGDLQVSGSADTAQIKLGAGRAQAELADVASAKLEVSAGRLDANLTGTAPQQIDARVSAGMLELTVPDTSYHVIADSSAGSVENRLSTSRTAQHTIAVDTSAGSAVLLPGDPVPGK